MDREVCGRGEAADAREDAGRSVGGGVQAWEREAGRENGEALAGVPRGHLLIYEAFRFVLGFLLFLVAHLPAALAPVVCPLGFGGGGPDVVSIVCPGGVSGAGTRPEAGDAVVGAGGEDVAEGVPVEGPDGEVVGVLEFVCGVDSLGGGVLGVSGVVGGGCGGNAMGRVLLVEEPVEDGAVDAAGGQQVLVQRVPRHGRDVFFVAAQEQDVAHHAEVEDPGGVVTGARSHHVAENGFEQSLCYGILVSTEGGQTAACPRVPQLDRVVLGPRAEQSLCGVPIDRPHLPAVSRQRRLLLARGEVPNLQRLVVRGGDEL